jgi:hypothetical protein
MNSGVVVVSFRTAHGTFVSARDDGTVSQAGCCKGWEQFLLVRREGGSCMFQTAHGTYLCTKEGESTLRHELFFTKPEHLFEVVSSSTDGKVGLQTLGEDRQFVSASKDDQAIGFQAHQHDWESFDMLVVSTTGSQTPFASKQ